MKYLVIIPTINSQKTILNAVETISKIDKKNNIELLVVDYGSSDLTLQYLENNKVPHLKTTLKTTYEKALFLGLKYAEMKGFDFAIEFDDLCLMGNNQILNIISSIDDEDIIIGKRNTIKKDKSKRFSSKVLSFVANAKSGIKMSDLTMRFKVFRVKACTKYLHEKNWYPTPDSIVQMVVDGLKYGEFELGLNLDYANDHFSKYFGNKKIRFKQTLQWIISIMLISQFVKIQKGEKNE